jgi:nucleotide-binding universal stress UspA family protein
LHGLHAQQRRHQRLEHNAELTAFERLHSRPWQRACIKGTRSAVRHDLSVGAWVVEMKILLAVDGSPHSQAAVDEIVRRPWPASTTVRIISVIRPYAPPATEFVIAGATLEEMRQQQASSAAQITGRAADVVKGAGLSAETTVREGDARSAIVDEADEWGADLIVVGSHGRTGLTRLLLGSVAQAIVGHASCSVEVVRRHKQRSK